MLHVANRVMRLCLFPTAILAVGPLAELAAQPPAEHASHWRRTAQGWERSELWTSSAAHEVVAPQSHGAPHPMFVAGLIAVVAIAALLLKAKRPAAIHPTGHLQPHLRRSTDRTPAMLSH